jgi:hypothetical protein
MKTITIQGVPYSVDGQVAHIYGTNIAIGTVTDNTIILKEGWQTDPAILTSLKEYRATLDTATKAALAKAAEIQKL